MKDRIEDLIEEVQSGDIEVLEAFIELRENKKVLEGLLENIKEFEKKHVIEIGNAIMDYPEGYKGYNIKLVNGRETFSYKNIPEWSDVDLKKKELEKKYKSLFKVYQSTSQRPISEDGEVYDLPEINYSSSYFKLTKARKKR